MVDTGAASSLSPLSTLNQRNLEKTEIDTLTSIDMGSVPVLGTITHQLDLGFFYLFELTFYATELDYGILGANFLSRHGLSVDMSTKRFLLLPEVERCYVSQDDIHKEFSPSSPSLFKDSCHGLSVDLSTKRFLRLPEVERCCVSQDDTHKKFFPSSPSLF